MHMWQQLITVMGVVGFPVLLLGLMVVLGMLEDSLPSDVRRAEARAQAREAKRALPVEAPVLQIPAPTPAEAEPAIAPAAAVA